MEREVEGIWGRLVNELPRGLPRTAFLANQRIAVYLALEEKGVEGGEELAAAAAARDAALTTFAECALELHMRPWTSWVKGVEAATRELLVSSGRLTAEAVVTPQQLVNSLPEGVLPPCEGGEAAAAVGSLSSSWRGALRSLNEEVGRYFVGGGGKGVALALRIVFGKVLEYHKEGEILLGRVFSAAQARPAWLRDFVPFDTVVQEIGRYVRNDY